MSQDQSPQPAPSAAEEAARRTCIRDLNDHFRTTLSGGRITITAGVQALGPVAMAVAIMRVRTFTAFDPDNDPHGEHDFGAFEVARQKLFWKIDYYDPSLNAGAEDPSDPAKTCRVLTVLLASEW